MAAFVAGLLGVSQQELRFCVERANQLTVAPFLSLYHSISPLLGLSVFSSDDSLLVAAVDEALPLPTSSQPAQLLEDADGEQNHARSDASALEPLSLNSDAKSQEGELQRTLCEQGLCGKGEALPQRGEREGETLRSGSQEGLAVLREALSRDEEEGSQWVGREAAELCLAKEVASIARLDGGCLAQIMSRLDNKTLRACSLVCREWLELSSFARTLMHLQEGPQVAALPTLVARFSRIQTLHIQGLRTPPLRMLQLGLPLTEQANIVPLDDSAINVIAQGCRNLRKLQMERCSGFSDVGLRAVLRGCSNLIDLRLSDCGDFTGEAFSGLACKLKLLELRTCSGVKNEGLLAAARVCPGLTDLRVLRALRGSSLAEGVEGAAKTCKGLRALMLHGCKTSDGTLGSIAASCPLLNRVHVSCEDDVTDAGLAGFLVKLPELESLAVQNMRGLSHVPRCGPCKRLKKLRLGCWWDTPDHVLREVSEETTLKELELERCPYLTDTTIDRIFEGCKSLKRLDLVKNDLLTADTMRAYLKSGKKVELGVRACPGITKETMPQDLVLEEVLRCL